MVGRVGVDGYVHFCLVYWSVVLGFGPSRLKALLDDWRLYLSLPRPRKVLDLLHGLKLLLPEVVPCPPVWPHRKKSDFDDVMLFPFDKIELRPLLTIADVLQIAVSASHDQLFLWQIHCQIALSQLQGILLLHTW